jgi:hypothetical protein
VTLATIILWCVSHQLEDVFGDMGVVAIIPLVLFFGTGILTTEDFNNFLWTIIILAAGGLSLGKAVNSSGLLHTIAGAITTKVEGFSLYGVLVVFASLILVVATFISHTVAALIILPLVHSVGLGMEEDHANLLVMGSALMCSAAMGLPTSGFPNMSKFAPFTSRLTTSTVGATFSLILELRVRAANTTPENSCHHDGGLTDGPEISASKALYQPWGAEQCHYAVGCHYGRIWMYAYCRDVTSVIFLMGFIRRMKLGHFGNDQCMK